MQLHIDYEEDVTPSGVQPLSRQYRCSIDLYVGRIQAPQQVLMLVDTAQVKARSRAKTYTYLLLLSSNEATPQHQEASPCLCVWGIGARRRPKKTSVQSESQLDDEERKTREKMRMRLTLLRTPVLADRRSTIPTPARSSNLGSHTIPQSSRNRR